MSLTNHNQLALVNFFSLHSIHFGPKLTPSRVMNAVHIVFFYFHLWNLELLQVTEQVPIEQLVGKTAFCEMQWTNYQFYNIITTYIHPGNSGVKN